MNILKKKEIKKKIIVTIVTAIILIFLLDPIHKFIELFFYLFNVFPDTIIPDVLSYLIIVLIVFYLYKEYWDLHFPKTKSAEALEIEVTGIEKICSDLCDKRNNRNKEREKNKKCPVCGKTTIVDKIRETTGKIQGDFILGFGDVEGEIKTKAVNHCSSCGNEWIKEKDDSIIFKSFIDETYNQIVRDVLYGLFSFSINDKGKRNKENDPLCDFSPEAIRAFIKRKRRSLSYQEGLLKLSKRDIKKYLTAH